MSSSVQQSQSQSQPHLLLHQELKQQQQPSQSHLKSHSQPPHHTGPLSSISNPTSVAASELANEVEAAAQAEAARKANVAAEALKLKRPQLTDLNAPTPPKPSLPLPARFRDPSLYDRDLISPLAVLNPTNTNTTEVTNHQPRPRVVQHPLYRTSAAVYGSRPPALPELPAVYFGNSHTFSNTFAGGMNRDNGLNTSLNKKAVEGKQEFGYI